jgi:anti-anti-sigma regulatory factor
VNLGEALDIVHASKLKDRLASSLSKKDSIVLIADKVKKADTAGLQLVYAFIKKATDSNKSVSWQKPSEELLQASVKLGLKSELNLS